jgi:transcriptional regulator with XRE-family HTH domain
MSQQELAKKIGMDTSSICRIEDGSRQASLETLAKISVALGCPIRAFFADSLSIHGTWE